jgi:hypothetical protein
MILVSAMTLSAQQIPAPSGPVIFCGTQATPNADSYQLVFNGGTPEAFTMDATTDAACPAGSTNSFRLPAARFTVGKHSVKVIASNAFGATDGPEYAVVVGIRPGQFTITAIVGGGL